MRVASRLAGYVRSRDNWLSVKPFDVELEKEYRQKQFEASIPPIIALAFAAGVAFLVLMGIQHFEKNLYQPYNSHQATFRFLAGVILLSAASALALVDKASPATYRIVFGLVIFLVLTYASFYLFRSTDQNSTAELGLAGTLYISAFCFRFDRVKFKWFMLTIGLAHLVTFFFLRGILAPINNFGPAFEIAARLPISFVPQVQVLQAFVFAYVIYSLMDSRERKLFLREKKLELSNQSRLHLLQAVGHDLRQPMTSILLQQGVAKEAAKLNNQAQLFNSLELIESSMQAISAELGQLTEIAAIQSSEYVPEIKSEAIAEIMNDLHQAFAAEAQSKEIQFNTYVQPALQSSRICTDRQILGRVLNNLVSNAIKYSKDDVHLDSKIDVIVLRSTSDQIEILVKDNGIGIAEENFEKIWQPFFQVENSERNRLKGYGLGLTQVRVALAKLARHRVECRSRVGEGSEFKVVIEGPSQGAT